MKEKILNKVDEILLLSLQKINLLHLSIINRYNLTKSTYQFLTANDKAENIDEYTKALNEALGDNKVKNIAISGSYGSGKSSFIKTFEKNNAKYNFLDISLATFKNKDIKDTDNKPDLSLIEKSILEQMFYKVQNKTIPQSRLNKIDRLKLIPFKIVAILIVTLSYFIVFSPKSLETITFFKDLIQINTTEYLKYLPIMILFLGAYYLLKKLLIVLSNTNIEKLNLQNLELVSNNDSGSLLNKYLDEILYFFEKTNFDVVVFQDLDRYDNLDIFTKLRELNNFINNSEQVNKKVVFIYAVKDEMFTSANERTKFFDFLIPIIPYINATNSKDILLDYFKGINQNFLYDISLYISDMRLLKNIYNEYLIYSNNLDEKLNKTKLLAMIIYKNFEPQDFELLHKCKGLVYNVFNEKNEYIKLYIKDIENNINKIKDKINEIANEPREDIKELRQLYILKIIENLNDQFDGNLYLDSRTINIQDSVVDESFELIKKSKNIMSKYLIPNHYSVWQNSQFISFEDIEKEIGVYDKREQLISNKINSKKIDLLKEIQILKDKQEELNNITIKELFEKFNDNTIFGDEDFKDKELLRYLISYGHIDENYEEYISNFFGVSITKGEQEFLRNIKNNGKSLSFNYELKNLKEIVEYRLIENEFQKEGVFNLYLVDYIIENKNIYSKQLELLFQQLSNDSDTSKEFILYYLHACKQKIEFVKLIVKYYKNLWLFFTENANDKLDTYFGWVVHYADYEDIVKLNENDSLRNYLTNISFMQKFTGNEANKVIKIIEDLDIKFTKLDSINSDEVLNFIFTKSYYDLNPYMINKMIFNKCAPQSEIEEYLQNAHLTTIKSDRLIADSDILIDYINNNIEQYISNVLLKIETNTKESEEIIIELLNNNEINNYLKEQITIKQKNKIQDITTIKEESLWIILLKQNFVLSTWDNIFEYYNYEEKSNDIIIDFLNIKDNARIIAKTRCGKEYSEANEFFTQDLLKLIIQTNDFNILSYEYLIKNLGYWYDNLDISGLDEEKISLLIKYNRFQFKKICFDMIKENTKTLQIELLEKNKDKLLYKFEEFEFDTDDIVDILQSVHISKSIKKELIEKIDYDLISNKTIAKLVYTYVDKKDIKGIHYTKKMLEHLEALESKINLIVEQKSEFNDEELVELLYLLPSEYSKIANLDGKQTILNENNYNKEFIKVLKDREFITKDKVEKRNKIRLYIKNKV